MAVTITQVHPDKLSTRRSKHDGSILYSQVVEVKGSGRMIFVAGQVARDGAGNDVGKGDMRAQIAQVGENIKDALEAVGASLSVYRAHDDLRHRHRRVLQARGRAHAVLWTFDSDEHHSGGAAACEPGQPGGDRGIRRHGLAVEPQ